MTRRRARREGSRLAALAAAAALASCGSAPDERPNVILVTIDTLRADHTTLGGYARDTTPELARWAKGGTVFEHALSTSSWTLPAMSMLLTGQVQVKNEGQVFPRQTHLAEIFREQGYRTGAVVANQLLTPERGFDRGFDAYQLYVKEGGGRALGWLASEVTARGIGLIEKLGGQDDSRPFFLLLHYFDPHDPYLPTDGLEYEVWDDPKRLTAFRAALPEEQRALLTHEKYRGIEYMIARYDSEVRQADRGLGELFRYLAATGLEDETIVVVTSDHGEGLWQRAITKGEQPKNEVFPHLYFEHGIQLYGEAIHVPLVFRGPGVPAGASHAQTVSLLDVVPTLLALLDFPRPPLVVGEPLLPAPEPVEPPPVFAICSRGEAVTVDGFRYHQPKDYKLEHGVVPELFDLEADPRETTPLDDPAREAELQGLIDAWLETWGQVDWGDAATFDPEALAAELEALGYTADEMFGEDRKSGGADGASGADDG